ncbi:MAG: peptidoglycan DD-metalloendopeptidase family protein [Epsilonproteobacteria bacterium]|nr:peptidoglycan DD-metalloendopeptidase family protein [Campylobacterota bacterium]
MKNKFIITITDLEGTKQYTLDKLIKKLLIWLVLLVAVTIGGSFMLAQYLSETIIELNQQKVDLLKTQQELLTQKRKLLKEKRFLTKLNLELLGKQQELSIINQQLKESIKEQHQALASVNEKLKEVEKILGLEAGDTPPLSQRLEKIEKSFDFKKITSLTPQEKKLLLRSVPTGKPIVYRRVSAPFGYRMHPIYGKKMFHFGVDLVARKGTKIYAPADGVVYFAGVKNGYGNFILLDHPFGFSTAYGHLQKIVVERGEFVEKGQLIGYVGNSGRSTGPHLHYEVRYLSYWLNPLKFIHWKKDPFESMKEIPRVDWQDLLRLLRKRYYVALQKK